jgi:hypothetical protein
MKKFQLVLALVILTISIVLLVWGFSPNPRETRIQTISPTEMRLPTPSSMQFELSHLENGI